MLGSPRTRKLQAWAGNRGASKIPLLTHDSTSSKGPAKGLKRHIHLWTPTQRGTSSLPAGAGRSHLPRHLTLLSYVRDLF